MSNADVIAILEQIGAVLKERIQEAERKIGLSSSDAWAALWGGRILGLEDARTEIYREIDRLEAKREAA